METLIGHTYTSDEIAARYSALEDAVPVRTIRSAKDYQNAIQALNGLLDAGGADENHALAAIVDTMGTLIEAYEREHVAIPPVTGNAALRYLMEQHGLRQSDLPEIGTQGVVSELLSGKRDLTARHISLLRDRFGVSADVFL